MLAIPLHWGFRALGVAGPAAAGHLAALAPGVLAVAFGTSLDRPLMLAIAAALLVALAARWACRRKSQRGHGAVAHGGLALGCFIVSTAQGAGFVLVPALLPLCGGAASGSGWGAAAATTGLHLAAMLGASAAMGAAGVVAVRAARASASWCRPATTRRGNR